eukprot:GEMP01083916.1.p1 GENE.GEMP01083916.1~~GEMP01083916.1.p1  ORF type:complete len:143 (+),score=25.62 GEMP01083916.1:40-429(+)
MPEGDLPEKYSFKPTADKPELDNSWGNNDAGRSSYTNGDTYTGDFKDGKKHGQGVYVYRNDDEYSGTYVENERHGVGLFTYAAGGKYHGNFSNGTHGNTTEISQTERGTVKGRIFIPTATSTAVNGMKA